MQPIRVVADSEGEEFGVKRILEEKRGRGGKRQYLVKWVDYLRLTWEPRDALEDTVALDVWERGGADKEGSDKP